MQKQSTIFPNDNPQTRREAAQRLVLHLQEIGQIPECTPEELKAKLDETFPNTK